MIFTDYLKEYESKLQKGEPIPNIWICDLRYADYSNKPIRHVPPTLVSTRDNSELPKNKTIYYSFVHFRKLKANGDVSATILSPFDNTGFRGRTGNAVEVFYSKSECEKRYAELKAVAVEGLKEHKDFVNRVLDERIAEWS